VGLRREILLAVRAEYEGRDDRDIDPTEYGVIGARVALEKAQAIIKSVKLIPATPQERLISKLLAARMLRAIRAVSNELDESSS
jgi:hypothetical protein